MSKIGFSRGDDAYIKQHRDDPIALVLAGLRERGLKLGRATLCIRRRELGLVDRDNPKCRAWTPAMDNVLAANPMATDKRLSLHLASLGHDAGPRAVNERRLRLGLPHRPRSGAAQAHGKPLLNAPQRHDPWADNDDALAERALRPLVRELW